MSLISGVLIGTNTVQNRQTNDFYTISDIDTEEIIVQYLHPWIFTQKTTLFSQGLAELYFCYFIDGESVHRLDMECITKIMFNSYDVKTAFVMGYIFDHNNLLRLILKCKSDDSEPVICEMSSSKTRMYEKDNIIIIEGRLSKSINYTKLAEPLISYYKT